MGFTSWFRGLGFHGRFWLRGLIHYRGSGFEVGFGVEGFSVVSVSTLQVQVVSVLPSACL